MLIFQPLFHFGRYCLMLKGAFSKPENAKMYWNETLRQMISMGIGSLGIVCVISFFLGAVTTVQTAYQLVSPIIPVSVVAEIVRDSSILELSVSVLCLVLAGKIGSNLASELGTMRISEQIDALEIMGVNSKAYLILPKILGALVAIPALVIISCATTILGGYLITFTGNLLTPEQYIYGLHDKFVGFNVTFCLIKAFTFGFIISSVSCYCGYYTEGGAFEIGNSSTKAVVWSCIFVLAFDFILAGLILSI
jgi:phospholipid/cholesterol/gamma-HCH transport system permease protein